MHRIPRRTDFRAVTRHAVGHDKHESVLLLDADAKHEGLASPLSGSTHPRKSAGAESCRQTVCRWARTLRVCLEGEAASSRGRSSSSIAGVSYLAPILAAVADLAPIRLWIRSGSRSWWLNRCLTAEPSQHSSMRSLAILWSHDRHGTQPLVAIAPVRADGTASFAARNRIVRWLPLARSIQPGTIRAGRARLLDSLRGRRAIPLEGRRVRVTAPAREKKCADVVS